MKTANNLRKRQACGKILGSSVLMRTSGCYQQIINLDKFEGKSEFKNSNETRQEWIDIRLNELEEDWELARAGKEVKKIAPLE